MDSTISKSQATPMITYDYASSLVARAVEEAKKRNHAVCVAVVDIAGNLKAFAQMDGSPLIAQKFSLQKAQAALMGLPSGALGSALESAGSGMHLNFAVNEDISLLPGGFPVMDGESIIGAIAVGGAPTTDDDSAITQAALGA